MKIQAVRGMHDLLDLESKKFEHIINIGKEIANLYCFETLHIPILEFAEVFERNLGEESDVISKEIYKFKDRGDRLLALRPEFTAGIARAYVEHSMHAPNLPKKFFSYGSLFRYDRPQAGRYRQFNQLNFEFIGIKNAAIDAECIMLGEHLLKKCNINNFMLNINFLGGEETIENYKVALQKYLTDYKNDLSADSQRRIETNPLRILDSKSPQDIKIIENAPNLNKYYSKEDQTYFSNIIAFLDNLKISYKINDRLVRGLDYYTGILFEFISPEGYTLLGGGRYDNLIEQAGCKVATPAIGFAAGIERLMLCPEICPPANKPKYGIIYYSENEIDYAMEVANRYRATHYNTQIIYGNGNIGSKIAKAGFLGCENVVICGPDEKASRQLKIKNLYSRAETTIGIDNLLKEIFL